MRNTRNARNNNCCLYTRARVHRININIYVCVINRRPVYERCARYTGLSSLCSRRARFLSLSLPPPPNNFLARKWSNSGNNVTFEVQQSWVISGKLRKVIFYKMNSSEINFAEKSRQREKGRELRGIAEMILCLLVMRYLTKWYPLKYAIFLILYIPVRTNYYNSTNICIKPSGLNCLKCNMRIANTIKIYMISY